MMASGMAGNKKRVEEAAQAGRGAASFLLVRRQFINFEASFLSFLLQVRRLWRDA